MRKRSTPKGREFPRLGGPPSTSREQAMWKEFAQLQDAGAPRRKLLAWARKHKVKLAGRNRFHLQRQYRVRVVARQRSCNERCSVKKFETTTYIKRHKTVMSCTLDGCHYEKKLGFWVCDYTCLAVMRAIK